MRTASYVGDVQVGVVDAPVRGEVLHSVALDVPLHGDQAAAELQAHGALVGCCASMGPEVFDHGRVVPWALTTEATLKRFLSLKQRQCTGRKTFKVFGGREVANYEHQQRLSHLYSSMWAFLSVVVKLCKWRLCTTSVIFFLSFSEMNCVSVWNHQNWDTFMLIIQSCIT